MGITLPNENDGSEDGKIPFYSSNSGLLSLFCAVWYSRYELHFKVAFENQDSFIILLLIGFFSQTFGLRQKDCPSHYYAWSLKQ